MKLLLDYYIKTTAIRKILAIYILIFTFVPSAAIYMFSYYYSMWTITDNYLPNYLASVHHEFENNMSSLAYKLNKVFLNIVTYKDLYSKIVEPGSTYDQKAPTVVKMLSDLLSNNNLIGAIDIVTLDNEVYSYIRDTSFSRADIEYDFLNSLSNTTILIGTKCLSGADNERYLPIGKKFFNYYTQYDVGAIIMYIRESELHDLYKNSALFQSSFFLTNNDYIISSQDKTQIGKEIFIPTEIFFSRQSLQSYNNKFILSRYGLSNRLITTDVQLVGIISHDELYHLAGRFTSSIILILCLTIPLSVLLAFIVSSGLLKEIVLLKQRMNNFDSLSDAFVPAKNTNEIWVLENSFNKLIAQIKKLVEQNNLRKENQRILELKALQAQINPHFIYNALDIIIWAAKKKKLEDIEEMTFAMASFFRIGLHNGENIITIKEEIVHVKSYLTIENLRFPGLFDVVFDIPDEMLSLKTIKIILQPLVENAIKHGFKKLQRKGLLTVKGYSTAHGDIIFEVRDNGKGMDFNPLETSKTGGYGLQNIQERLLLEFGEGYGLQFESQINNGTIVFVRMKMMD